MGPLCYPDRLLPRGEEITLECTKLNMIGLS